MKSFSKRRASFYIIFVTLHLSVMVATNANAEPKLNKRIIRSSDKLVVMHGGNPALYDIDINKLPNDRFSVAYRSKNKVNGVGTLSEYNVLVDMRSGRAHLVQGRFIETY